MKWDLKTSSPVSEKERKMSEKIGDYEYNSKDLIGHGAFAVVFKGRNAQVSLTPFLSVPHPNPKMRLSVSSVLNFRELE